MSTELIREVCGIKIYVQEHERAAFGGFGKDIIPTEMEVLDALQD